jgi:hypothetical protein
MRYLYLLLVFLLSSCASKALPADVDEQVIRVYVSPAAEPWLEDVYDCAARSPEWLVERTPDIILANLVLRVDHTSSLGGEPYQIGEAELVLLLNADNPLSQLSRKEVQAIFTGNIHNWAEVGGDNANIQIWAYSAESDLQQAFYKSVLGNGALSSLAKQAQSPGAMQEAVAGDLYAIGFALEAEVQSDERIHISAFSEPIKLPILIFPSKTGFERIENLITCLQM